MTENSKIEWTDHTFNPWWGCTKTSPGCKNCYAERIAKRYGYNVWGHPSERDQITRRTMSKWNWRFPLRWNRQAERAGTTATVFCGSMCDVFEPAPGLTELRKRLWDLVEQTPHLTWLILTKRPEYIWRNIPSTWCKDMPANVWFGTSVENQDYTSRVVHLMTIKANLFLSLEPLLSPIQLTRLPMSAIHHNTSHVNALTGEVAYLGRRPALGDLTPIRWVISGGETGRGARPSWPEWHAAIQQQCAEYNVPYFLKSWGEYMYKLDWANRKIKVPIPYPRQFPNWR